MGREFVRVSRKRAGEGGRVSLLLLLLRLPLSADSPKYEKEGPPSFFTFASRTRDLRGKLFLIEADSVIIFVD